MKGIAAAGNIALGTLAGIGVNFAIDGIINLIYNAITATERAIEKGEEAKSRISEVANSYKSTKASIFDLSRQFLDNSNSMTSTEDAVSSLTKRYEELSDGVNKFTNQNLSLSSDDYQEYVALSNEMASLFPSLVSGYDIHGNALLSLGSGAQSAAEQLQALCDTQRQMANYEIGKQLEDAYKGTIASTGELEDEIKNLETLKQQADNVYKNATSQTGSNSILDQLDNGGVITIKPGEVNNVMETEKDVIQAIISNAGLAPDTMLLEDGSIQIMVGAELDAQTVENIKADLASSIQNDAEMAQIDSTDYAQQIAAHKLELQDEWKSISGSIGEYLQTSDSFNGLSGQLQGAFLTNLSNLDPSVIGEKYNGNVKNYIYSEFLQPMDELTPDAQNKLGKLLELDPKKMTDDDYFQKWTDTLENIFPDDLEKQMDWKKKLGLEKTFLDTKDTTLKLLNEFKDDTEKINDLTIGDKELLYQLVFEDGFTGTFDSALTKIKETKEATEELSIASNKMFDGINEADQTQNAGDDYKKAVSYLEEAKAMYNSGEIGTDDFKARAAYFSPTASDDPKNFAENLSKAERYLTEDRSGTDTFLSDLESKGFATMSTLADGTEKWSFSMNDLAGSAREMGMGFEFFMDMFGRLDDYGISNNFVDNQQEGVEHLTELYSQLAEEEANLSNLTSEGDYETTEGNTLGNQTAIEASKAKIEELKASVEETLGYMDLLVNKSAEDYETEVTSAKDAIDALAEQRQTVLENGGENSESVAAMYEDEILALAEKYHIPLDFDLSPFDNSEIDDQIEEKKAELAELQESLDSASNKTERTSTLEEIDQTREELSQLYAEKQQLDEPLLMTVDASNMETDMQGPIQTLQDFYNQSSDLLATKMTNPSMDTSEAEESLGNLNSEIANFSPEVKAALSIEGLTPAEIFSAIQLDIVQIPATVGVATEEVNSATVDGFTPDEQTVPVKTGVLNTATLITSLPPLIQNVLFNYINSPSTGSNTTIKHRYTGPTEAFGTVGTSNANGNWGVPHTGTSLVGELGREIVVRNGRFFTVGDVGAEFANLQKGDIVFNHKQTEMLLNRGFLSGRGRMVGGNAFAEGTAYASGSGDQSNSVLENTLKSLAKLFDWIELKIKSFQRKVDLNTAKAENAERYQKKNKYIATAMDENKSAIKAQKSAQKSYNTKANAVAKEVGLSKNLKDKVKKGAVKISSLSEDDKKRVEEYQKWYDKAQEAKKTIQDLTKEQKKLAQTRLDNIIDQYDSIIDLAKSAKKYSEAMVDYYTSSGQSVNSENSRNAVMAQMAQENTITNNLEKEQRAYKKQLNKIKKTFGTNSDEYREAQAKLQDLSTEIVESKTNYNKLNAQLREMDLTKLEYVADVFDSLGNKLKAIIDLKLTRGQTVTESDYQNQAKNNNNTINSLSNYRNERIKDMAKATPYSEEWKKAYDDVNRTDQEILNLLGDNEKLKKSINEVRWKPFEDLQEKVKNSLDELDYLRGMFDEEMMYEKDGKLTDKGQANIALLGSSIKLANQQIADYSTALNNLQADLKTGNITQEDYNKRSAEFMDVIKDNVSAVDKYKDELIKMHETALKKNNDTLLEYIDIRQKANTKDKQAYEYQKKLKSQYKDVSALRAQILALEGTTNLAAQAELERLRAELADAEETVNETLRDHEYDMISEGYDKMSEDAKKTLDDTLETLKSNSEEQEKVVDNMLQNITSNYKSAYSAIEGVIADTGLVITTNTQATLDAVKNSAQSLYDTLGNFKNATTTASGTNTTKVDTTENGKTTSAEASSKTDPIAQSNTVRTTLAEEKKKLLTSVKSFTSNLTKKKLSDKELRKHTPLFQYIYKQSSKANISNNNILKLGKLLSLAMPSSKNDITDNHKNQILTKLKEIGYAAGTRNYQGDGLAWMDEAGPGSELVMRKSDNALLTRLKPGDNIFPANATENLWAWAAYDPNQLSLGSMGHKNLQADDHSTSIGNIEINMYGRTYKDDIDYFRSLPNSVAEAVADKVSAVQKKEARKLGMR